MTLYFTAGDGEWGYELWRSAPPYDDTTTKMVADLNRGAASSNPGSVIVVQNSLFFAATDDTWGREVFQFGGYYAIPNTGFAPDRISIIAAQPAEKAYQSLGALELQIPGAAVQAEIVGVPQSVDGWDLDWLSTQVGYLSGTAFPTHSGNSVLTAHVYLPDGSPGPFVNLKQVQYGQRIHLDAWGQRYTYEVRAVQTITPQDSQTVFQHEEKPWLTLITCQGFDPQTGQYRSRLMVRAVLVDVTTLP
jgi:LPXTG-site transpeptidase (sortase) family protein